MESKRRLVRYPQLKSDFGIPYSRTRLRELEKLGLFPRRVFLIDGKSFAHVEGELVSWIEAKVERREASMCGSQRNTENVA